MRGPVTRTPNFVERIWKALAATATAAGIGAALGGLIGTAIDPFSGGDFGGFAGFGALIGAPFGMLAGGVYLWRGYWPGHPPPPESP
jgi:hypothetical protein